jgi:glycosyltransferase involved in cell wall biosynthesis
MHFLLVNYEYPPIGAGAANATWHIGQCLLRDGHRVSVLTAAFGDLRGWSEDQGVTIYRCLARRRAAERSNITEMASFIAGGMLALPRVMKRLRPDACIVFFSIPGGPVALAANLAWGLPYVVSLRGGDVPGSEFTLVWSHRLLKPLRRLVLKRSRAVVANSEGLKKLTERADPYPAIVIPSGVDSGYFHPAPRPPDGIFRAIFVGRFHAQKNIVALVEQFAAAANASSVDMRLDLIGDGPERQQVEDRIASLGMRERISLLGWIPRAELLAAYQRADSLVNPSIGEGLPNVVLEAMACGLPVIASRVAGNDTLVRDLDNGLLFDVRRDEEMAQCLQRMASDEAMRRRMGERAREVAVAEYSWQSVARQYSQLFSKS